MDKYIDIFYCEIFCDLLKMDKKRSNELNRETTTSMTVHKAFPSIRKNEKEFLSALKFVLTSLSRYMRSIPSKIMMTISVELIGERLGNSQTSKENKATLWSI